MRNQYDDSYDRGARVVGAGASDYDLGLRDYLIKVFNYMAGGLAVTGVVAFLTASSPTMIEILYGKGLFWIVAFAPIIMAMVLGFRIQQMSTATAQLMFWAFSGVMGLSMASIFLVYTGSSIAQVFFITASMFAAMALYGYTTKRDLSSMGSFMTMGLIGIVIASIVNMFFGNSTVSLIISVLGVIIFTGLTAYDIQNIRNMYYYLDSPEATAKVSIMGALKLYLDFINLFTSLLYLFGDRR